MVPQEAAEPIAPPTIALPIKIAPPTITGGNLELGVEWKVGDSKEIG